MTKSERNKIIYARFEEGYSQKEIGLFYGLSQSAVSLIIVNIRNGVVKPEKETRGAKSRLSPLDMENLVELLKTSPTENGFTYWNKWTVQSLIKEKFGVDYHENYIWRIMEKIGFSSQIPQEKDYRQSSEKVSYFKKEKIAAIKKSE